MELMEFRAVIAAGLLELVLLVILSSWYLIHGWWVTRIGARRQADYERAVAAVSRFIATGRRRIGEDDYELIRRLERPQQFSLFTRIASLVSPGDRVSINRVAEELGLLRVAERGCRSRHWWKRLESVRFLSAVGSNARSPVEFLDDPRLEVRAQAVEWAGDRANPRWIPDLIEVLGDPSGLCRYSVQDALLRAGHAAVGPLATYLEGDRTEEQIGAALTVAQGVADATLLEPILRLSRHEQAGIREPAAVTLGSIGGQRARGRLVEMTTDPDGEVRAAAVESLAGVAGPEAAGDIAGHLTDREWNVRRAAGLALRRMGATGTVLLRDARRSSDRFARDMAALVLELPPEESAS